MVLMIVAALRPMWLHSPISAMVREKGRATTGRREDHSQALRYLSKSQHLHSTTGDLAQLFSHGVIDLEFFMYLSVRSSPSFGVFSSTWRADSSDGHVFMRYQKTCCYAVRLLHRRNNLQDTKPTHAFPNST